MNKEDEKKSLMPEGLKISHEKIDGEHELFFIVMKDLYEAIDKGYKELQIAMRDVTHHLSCHFSNEEKLMEEEALHPAYIAKHAKIHAQCIKQIGKMKTTILKKNSEDDFVYQKKLATNMASFIKNWLVFHILAEDKKIGVQIEKINQKGYTPEEAYKSVEEGTESSLSQLTQALSNLLKIYEDRNDQLSIIEADVQTKLKKKEKELQEQIRENKKKSITDELTGLYNRRQAMFVLNNIWNEYQDPTCAIIQLDLDKFKEVNDTYGHHAGDLVLKQFSTTVKYFFETNELCNKYNYSDRENVHFCRLGGDEFLVILQKYSLDEAVAIANALHTVVNNIEVLDEHKKLIWRGSTSIGVAARNSDFRDFESVLKAADSYLYKAKEDGRNCVRSMLHEIGGGYF